MTKQLAHPHKTAGRSEGTFCFAAHLQIHVHSLSVLDFDGPQATGTNQYLESAANALSPLATEKQHE
jgi:hypothetical protein